MNKKSVFLENKQRTYKEMVLSCLQIFTIWAWTGVREVVHQAKGQGVQLRPLNGVSLPTFGLPSKTFPF